MANLTNFVLYLSKSVESFTPLPNLAEPSSVVVKLVGVWGGRGEGCNSKLGDHTHQVITTFPGDRLKILYLHFHKSYAPQTWQGSDLGWLRLGRPHSPSHLSFWSCGNGTNFKLSIYVTFVLVGLCDFKY